MKFKIDLSLTDKQKATSEEIHFPTVCLANWGLPGKALIVCWWGSNMSIISLGWKIKHNNEIWYKRAPSYAIFIYILHFPTRCTLYHLTNIMSDFPQWNLPNNITKSCPQEFNRCLLMHRAAHFLCFRNFAITLILLVNAWGSKINEMEFR